LRRCAVSGGVYRYGIEADDSQYAPRSGTRPWTQQSNTVGKRYAALVWCGTRKSVRLRGVMLKVWPMYRIREVDGHDDEIMDTLADLHQLTFFDGASIPEFDHGHWWLAFHETMPVAFAGVVPSTRAYNAGYFCRVGVLKKHCGNALQLRLMRALESRARHNGWCCIVSDTTDNLASANNFIRAGYRLYQPQYPWAWPNTLYWRKCIK
jgi:hypothetical protein